MTSLVNSTSIFINDIMEWHITHPDEGVELRFGCKTTGEKCFYCVPSCISDDKPLVISYKELSLVFDKVSTWVGENFVSGCVTNEWGDAITTTPSEYGYTSRLTLVFSQRNNIDSIDVRKWCRVNSSKIFTASARGFSITGKENIITFIKMREAITKRIARIDKLEELVIKAHGIMYKVYNENCMNHPSGTSIMRVVNIKEFAHRWNDEMK